MGILKSSKSGLGAHLSAKTKFTYALPDIAPMERIQHLLEAHYKVIQVPIGLVAPDSTLLLSIGWQRICEQFHRMHPESERHCIESNKRIQSKLADGKIAAEKCANGLWDIAMPIIVADQHLATLFIGQFLYEDEARDLDFFKQQAQRCGYDEASYLAALGEVPRLSRELAQQIIGYTSNLVALLAESGYKNKLLAQEVQERRLAEYALLEGERQYRALVENVPGAVYLCLNDDSYTTIFMSDAIEEIAGYAAQSMIDEAASIARLIHPDDVEEVHRQVDEALENRRPYVLSYRLLRADGTYIWAEERGQGVYDDANTLRFLQGVIFDVNERHHMEEERNKLDAQMSRTQKLDSLGILAGGIAHDFNNLLVAILGHADLAQSDIEPDSPARESLEAIVNAARLAARLTQQMLAYSGKGHLMVEPVDLEEIVEQTLPALHAAVEKGFQVRHERVAPVPRINADTTQIQQLLINVVVNAAEAYSGTEGKGDILIRTGSRYCNQDFIERSYYSNEHKEGLYAYIEVVDQGCGMDDETRRRLCDPFFSTKFPGRGLGMAAVLGIVRGHGGLIAVNSAPGHGARVQVLFPVETQPKQQENTYLSDARKTSDAVLVVADEEIVRNVAGRMLNRAGFQFTAVSSGQEALRLLRENSQGFTCVILDLAMPIRDGEKTFHAIREIDSHIPIILSSGYSRDELKARLADVEPSALLQKPYTMDVLMDILRRTLR